MSRKGKAAPKFKKIFSFDGPDDTIEFIRIKSLAASVANTPGVAKYLIDRSGGHFTLTIWSYSQEGPQPALSHFTRNILTHQVTESPWTEG